MGLEVGGGGMEEEEEKEEKIPLCESVGHRPLWGRCPGSSLKFDHNLLRQGTDTADHLMLLRLFIIAPAQTRVTWVGGRNKGGNAFILKSNLHFKRLLLLYKSSKRAQLRLISKSYVCSLKLALIEVIGLIR